MLIKLLPLTLRKLKVLTAIYTYGNLHSGKIVQITGLERSHISTYVKDLHQKNIIEIHKKTGNIVEYCLSEKAKKILSKFIETYRKEDILEKKEIKKIYNKLITNQIINKIDKIYLIGSYAKKEETKKSDVDMVLLTDDGKQVLFEIKKIRDSLRKYENINFQTIIYSNKELKKEKDDNSIFFKTTLKDKKNRIILYQKE